MRGSRGQALVELALCAPVVLLLGLGLAGVVEVADASAGLNAATEAAVATAARAPDAAAAEAAARARFAAVVAAYPLKSPALTLSETGFARGSVITASAVAFVDLGWESVVAIPVRVDLRASASTEVDPWRTR
jgi:Flp pilus assembly protein TadG